MGIAIVIGGCNFAEKNLGKVTFLEDESLSAINIVGKDNIEGKTVTYTVSYIPVNSSQRGVTWSITAGSDYASIDSATGILTIKSTTTTAQSVTIRATSTVNASIFATKTISVKYAIAIDILNSITINCKENITGDKIALGIIYNPANTALTGVSWSITSGNSYATIDAATGVLTINSNATSQPVTIVATSKHNAEITATKTVIVTYSEVFWNLTGNVGFIPLASIDLTKVTVLIESVTPLAGLSTNYCNFLFSTQEMSVNSAERSEIGIVSTYQNIRCILASESAGVGEGWATKAGLKTFIKKDIKIILMNPDGVQTGNSIDSLAEGTWSVASNSQGQAKFVQYVQFGTKTNGGNAYSYKTNAALAEAVRTGSVTPGDNFNCKIKKFILFSATKYTTVNEILANRNKADIDIQFDADGLPFNAGKSGSLIYSGN